MGVDLPDLIILLLRRGLSTADAIVAFVFIVGGRIGLDLGENPAGRLWRSMKTLVLR